MKQYFCKNFFPGGNFMAKITLSLEPLVLLFYRHIANKSGKPLEEVLSDALFKLAGELSLQALKENQPTI